MSNSETEYKDLFGLGSPPDEQKAKAAHDLALDIRKFEIGLYWQRATYFWTLIAVAFAGYFAILSADKLAEKEYLAYIVSCIGLIFTWAWFLVNHGSKYWQENWEAHVDMLENDAVGPLYKTVLHRPGSNNAFARNIFGPQAISVSKVNVIVNIFTLCIWLVLVIHSLPLFDRTAQISWKHVTIGAMTLFFMIFMRLGAKTDLGSQERILTKRVTRLNGTTKEAELPPTKSGPI